MPRLSPYKHKLRVATRASELALRQVTEVFAQFPELSYQIVPIQSYGDRHKDVSLINNKIQDFFTRELDEAILNGQADLAVHSAKDLPYPLPAGLEIITLFEAFDKTDAIVSRNNVTLSELPVNPKLGTSSLLRKAELLKLRDDIDIMSIRGTIEERIRQVDMGQIDAVIIATCALKRLGLEHRIAEVLPFETHPLQGHLAVVAKSGNNKLKSIFKQKDIRNNYGKVWLVGFGPGNPDLLTIQGLKALKKADAVYYDDLLNKDFLSTFKAQKVYVGKRKGNHSIEQSEINKLLLLAATSAQTVVRLKGGDPMLFAHGGEEVEYLQRNLVEVQVVPGISTALAAAAYTRIPLTFRGISSKVTLMTGHSKDHIQVPNGGTIVYYMGAANLSIIAEEALKKGWSPDTPVLMVFNVSNPDQEQYFTTLQQILNEPKNYKTPLIIIIGDVVRIKTTPSENIAKPVFLVTGTQPAGFSKHGEVIHKPLIEIRPLAEYNQLFAVFEHLHDFHWIIFTSRYAVQYFFAGLLRKGKDTRSLAEVRIASVGSVTTAELLKYGIVPDLQPEIESSEGMVALFRQHKISQQQILIPRSDIALPILPEGLTEAGNKVVTITVYENALPQNIHPVELEKIDFVVLSSPSCVENFFKIYKVTAEQKFIVQGDTTLKKLLGHSVHINQIIRKEVYEKVS
jgi:uroporphyrinogen III methyltransferase / synthase